MMEADESRRELLEAVAGLSERERDVLGLKFGARMGNRRITEMTGLSDSKCGRDHLPGRRQIAGPPRGERTDW